MYSIYYYKHVRLQNVQVTRDRFVIKIITLENSLFNG